MALSSKIKKALKLAGKKFKKVDAAAGGGFVNEAVEDGGYEATLTAAELKEIGGKAAVCISYTISDGDAEGEVVTARYFLETDQNLSYLKKDLGRFAEVDEDDFDLETQLEDTLEAIVGAEPTCKISVRMAGEFQNVYLNKVDVDGGDDDEDDDEDDGKKKGKKTASGGKGGKKGGKKTADDEDDDEEDDDEDDEDPEIEEGDTVLFKAPRAKKAKPFTVTKIKKGKATIEDEDGNEHSGIILEKLELVDADADTEDDDEDDDEDESPKKKGKKGKKSADDDDEDDEDADDDEESVDIEEGSKVVVNYKGKEYKGKVVSLDEDDETVDVKFKVGDKSITKTFSADKVEA